MATIEKIYPEYIHLDGGTQPRAKIDPNVCKEYEERMKAGERFPPVDVYFDGENYWLADGFHRHQAQVFALPGEAIECNVFQGTQQDAQWHSYGVNKTHGLRRTNGDKERAVRASLAHPMGAGRSNVEIAEHCGVSEFMVRKWRPRATSIKSKSEPSSHESEDCVVAGPEAWRPRTGRDGRTINTAKIGRKAAKNGRAGRGIGSTPYRVKLGYSKPLRMIPVQFCPENPHTAAATLIELFPRSFLEGLVEDLTQHLNHEGASE